MTYQERRKAVELIFRKLIFQVCGDKYEPPEIQVAFGRSPLGAVRVLTQTRRCAIVASTDLLEYPPQRTTALVLDALIKVEAHRQGVALTGFAKKEFADLNYKFLAEAIGIPVRKGIDDVIEVDEDSEKVAQLANRWKDDPAVKPRPKPKQETAGSAGVVTYVCGNCGREIRVIADKDILLRCGYCFEELTEKQELVKKREKERRENEAIFSKYVQDLIALLTWASKKD